MEHKNAERIRGFFQAFASHDISYIKQLIAPDALWHIPGKKHQLRGDKEGLEAILEFLKEVGSLTDGSFGVEVHDVVANDNWAVAMFTGSGNRDGKSLINPTCLKIRFEGGQVKELWEFVWDLSEVEEFWS